VDKETVTLSLGCRIVVVRGPLVAQPGVLVNRFGHGVEVLLDDGFKTWLEDGKVEELEIDFEEEIGEVAYG
jgi:hypothetical protein